MERLPRKQTTIKDTVSVSGFGFWSGRDVDMTFHPAEAGIGIVFVRVDLPGAPQIPAVIQNRVNGPRRTTLVAHGCPVEMVEHVLAALAGLQIDNCIIHVDRAEMPGFDGSSQAFVDALLSTEIVELEEERRQLKVVESVRVGDEFSWIQATPSTDRTLDLSYHLSYPCPAIGEQIFQSIITKEAFIKDISSARTFVLESEARQLQEKGLGQRVTYQDVLVFDDQGPVDNRLRFEDECARHKMLDMIGDFSLSGMDLIGTFTACKSGHRLNSRMVFELLQQIGLQNRIRLSA